MKKTLKILGIVFICIIIIVSGYTIHLYRNSAEKQVDKYEQKYLSTKADVDLINLVYSLDQLNSLDERRLTYYPMLIDIVTDDNISQSLYKTTYEQSKLESPRDFAILINMGNWLYFEKYDLFINACEQYYPGFAEASKLTFSGFVCKIYSQHKNIKAVESTVIAYSKIAKNTDDEVLIQSCLANIVTLRDVIKDNYGEEVSIDNEFLRTMTVDGEHIPITAKGKIIRYYCVSTGEYVEKI